ncbi:MAG: hypothetical protein Q4E35_04935 [Eubacteriales bacterium]|nr:hypothetical protein [Eubacteriales bacterium]
MGRDSKYDNHYIVKSDKGYGLVHKQFLRLEGEAAYESWTGYTLPSTVMYTDYTMKEVKVDSFEKGTEITVLEKLDTCFLVSFYGQIGVIQLSGISLDGSHELPAGFSAPSSGGTSSGGDLTGGMNGGSESGNPGSDFEFESGSGGGGSGSGGKTPSGPVWDGVSREGSDIIISGYMNAPSASVEKLATVIEQTDGEITGKAEIIISGAPLLGAIYERGETVRVSEWGDDTATLSILGFFGDTEARFLRKADAPEYESWICYTTQGAKLYEDIGMAGNYTPFNKNTEFKVVADMESCYLVDGGANIGYIAKDQVSDCRIVETVSPSSDVELEWTAPVF